ncbi:MAG TPA: threonine--tRNA ligase [Oligoflexia bacterium]|nr:threonine--tRNA ligase [Oligoflexia bacterium]HMP27253.1 threonine--tRNA ligase [Oligoflexia bacterium]
MKDTESSLYKLRHSLAHVMAQAVLELRPNSQLAFGPPIDDGCYYDFLFEVPITEDDFPEIEKRMRKIISERQEFIERKLPADEALKLLEKQNQKFKLEYCRELVANGESEIGFFRNGSFEDMCAGPHLRNTGELPPDCFKIDSLAGAYWRGSEKNPQLSRLYCLAFENKEDLRRYLELRKLAEERDHRKLGKELELFVISEYVGPGLPLLTPKGTVISEELEKYAKELEQLYGYQRVTTPHIAKEELFKISGHLPYYKDDMFPPMHLEGESDYYLKAMNCPLHHQIYSMRPRSYRELPLRFAETGCVYRYEKSGTLSGLLRVRAISQNDAHIYCSLEQIREEMKKTCQLTIGYLKKFRFEKIKLRYSTHDPTNKQKFVDNPPMWKYTEGVIEEILRELGEEYFLGFGEASFYGPKIDFQATTGLGREESISTTQLDFAQPERFNLTYIGEDGKEHRPFIIHRAPLGSYERFLAFLIEHFGGAFPTWLAPTQIKFIPVGEQFFDGALKIAETFRQALFRIETDCSSDSFNKKIRAAVTEKIPNIVVIGSKEIENGTLTLRRYCLPNQVTVPEERFRKILSQLVSERLMDNFVDVSGSVWEEASPNLTA